jgi:hypothetical protein
MATTNPPASHDPAALQGLEQSTSRQKVQYDKELAGEEDAELLGERKR